MTNLLLNKFHNLLNHQLNYIDKIQIEMKKRSKDLIKNQISENFYLFVSFSFCLFIYGFYFALKSKYKDQFIENFIKNNLPGISQPTQNLNWETFENILIKELNYQNKKYSPNLKPPLLPKSKLHSKTNFCVNPLIQQINFYTDHINIKLNPILEQNKNQNFIGIFHNKNNKDCLLNDLFELNSRHINTNGLLKITSPVSKLTDPKNGNLYWHINTIDANLDDIPKKIESKNTSNIEPTVTNSKFFNPLKKTGEEKTVSNIRKKFQTDLLLYNEKGKIPKNFFKNSTQGLLKNAQKRNEISDFYKLIGIEPSVRFLQDLHLVDPVFKKNDINNELKKIFFVKGISPPSSLKNEIKIENKTFEKKYNQLSESGLGYILKNTKIQKNVLIRPRQMSGYLFPDMSETEIKKLYIQFFFQNILNIKSKIQKNFTIDIILPPSCEIPSEQEFLNENTPKIKLQYMRTILAGQKNLESLLNNDIESSISEENREKVEIIPISEFVYKGPGIFLDKKTNDVFIDSNEELKNWKNRIFSGKTPLTDKKENFFGKKNFLHGENITERKLIELKEQSIDKGFLWNQEKKINQNKAESKIQSKPLPLKKTELNREFLFKKRTEKNKKIDRRFDLTRNKIYKRNTIIPVFEFSTIPYLSPKDWYKIFKAQIEETLVKETDLTKIKISIPSFIIGIGKKDDIHFSISQLEYQNFYQMVLSKNHLNPQKNIFHFIPLTQSTNQETAIQNSIIDGIYKKNLTLYKTPKSFNENLKQWDQSKKQTNNIKKNFHFLKESKKETFQESWQSVTKESWMLIYKICFALWLQEIAKDFYKKYGKEILFYVIDLFAALGFDTRDVIDQLQLGNSQNSLRIIRKTNKRFEDIAGIDSLLPELSEIVWFLRNSARGSKIPKGILFIGPPGTGKTFLVQALAGEAQIPVVVQSASSLIDMEEKQSGSQRLKNVFEKARELAPCILFIDEIDTLGAARENVMINTMGEDELLESISQVSSKKETIGSSFIPTPKLNGDDIQQTNQEADQLQKEEFSNIFQSHQEKNQIKQHRLALLMQFLVEMDGLKSLNGVVVIGATNRASVLDPAFTRPGRFEKILELGLPNKKKRIEILKLYSQNLGINRTVSWDYLGNMTEGLSAADLSAAMNQSSLKAILEDSIHSLETIEYGIDTITRQIRQSEKLKLKQYKDPFFIKRLAFYQAGKIIIQSILPNHPPLTFLSIWPETGNSRQKYKDAKLGRSNLETLLIGLYAGKASEILTLIESSKNQNENIKNKKLNSMYFWESNLGLNDLKNASELIISMIENWYFYSKKILIQKDNEIAGNQNKIEIQDPLLLDLFQNLYQNLKRETQSKKNFQKNLQNWLTPCWWQEDVKKQSELVDLATAHWYRIYLPDPEETEQNEEWAPPDQFFNSTQNLKNLSNIFIKIKNKREITWNDFSQMNRDYIYHGLISNSFNKAFCILDNNRELLDFFASYLLKFDKIREPEIQTILKKFHSTKNGRKNKTTLNLKTGNSLTTENTVENDYLSIQDDFIRDKSTQISFEDKLPNPTNIEKNWGDFSRRKKSFFINFDIIY